LFVAERRRAAFISVRDWAFHAVDRIAGNGIAFAKIIEE
jgi:hypothetical protein